MAATPFVALRADTDLTRESASSSASIAGKRSLLSNLVSSHPLMHCFIDFLESPFDWHSLCVISRYIRQHCRDQFILRIRAFKSELNAWTPTDVVAEASRSTPDLDRIVFTLQSRQFGKYSRAAACEKGCLALVALLPSDREPLELWKWAPDTAARPQRMAERGALEWVLKAMEEYPESCVVQESGCQLLDSLSSFGSAQTCSPILLAVLSAMEMHLGAPKVQESGCKALRKTAFSDESIWISAGGIKAILAAMKEHPEAASVQKEACHTLSCLLTVDQESSRLAHRESIRTLGGLQLILDALGKFVDNEDLQCKGWRSIEQMLKVRVNDLNFSACGGVVAITKTLNRYHSDWACKGKPGLITMVCGALRYYSAESEAFQSLQDNDVLALLRVLKNDYILSEQRMEHCCFILGNLAREPLWIPLISWSGVIPTILKAMERILISPFAQEACCYALSQLFKDEPKQTIRSIRAVLKAMNDHPSESGVLLQGCRFIACVGGHIENAARIGELAGCNRVLAAMTAHLSDIDLQIQGCRALQALIIFDANKATLVGLGVVGALVNAMEEHRGSEELLSISRQLLRSLSESGSARSQSLELRVVSLLL